MAGHQISLLRVLRLKDNFQATVTLAEFKEMNQLEKIVYIFLQDSLQQYLFVMCCAMYAPMRLLCIANQKISKMDKLHFFVLQTNRMPPIWLKDVEERIENLFTAAMNYAT